MLNEVSTQGLDTSEPSITPMNGLAIAAVQIMRLLRIGPYGHAQRSWQSEMETSRSPIATQVELPLAFDRFDQANGIPVGTTLQSWQRKVIEPACVEVAQLLTDLHVFGDHPGSVRKGLFTAGLLPSLAAQRISQSRESSSNAIAAYLSKQTLQSLRRPPRGEIYQWSGQRNSYAKWMGNRSRNNPQQQVVYPVSDANWSQEIRSWPVPLRVTLNAAALDADIVQRLWPHNRIKVMGTLIWHPKIALVEHALLRHIGHTDSQEYGIVALANHMGKQRFDSVASPILLIEAVEKTLEVSTEELSQAMRAFVTGILAIHCPGKALGTVVWNALPAPWIYPPNQEELLADDWAEYSHACLAVEGAINRLAGELRRDHGHAMGSTQLKWTRRG